MRKVEDIKIILHDGKPEDNEIKERFLNLKGSGFIEYSSEEDLALKINNLRKEGFLSKEVLILKDFKGRFFQQCPGSRGMICCNYRVINTCFNCLYDCAYCFLNSYLNSFGIVQFTNTENIFTEIDAFSADSDKEMIYRIGSGEYTDSLMMDSISGIGKRLIEKCGAYPNIMIELKTKSKNIDHLLSIKNKGNAVLSWSLNTGKNVLKYEKDTSSVKERIEAASKACMAGFNIAFHFDPVIIYKGWEDDYKALIEELFDKVEAEKMVWISMGGFRYSPGFKEVIRGIFPEEEMTTEEMFPCSDGKFRYLKNKRVDIYKNIKRNINRFTERPFLYLCMESSDVWNSVFQKNYSTSDMLEKDFSDHLKKNIF